MTQTPEQPPSPEPAPVGPRATFTGSTFGDFLRSRLMITPILIQVIFWIGVGLCVIGGLVAIARGEVSGVVVLLLGPLVVRIYCELLIVIFKILEALTAIRRNTGG